MTELRKAAEKALKALQENMQDEKVGQWDQMDNAITALRQALAQPEPVSNHIWMTREDLEKAYAQPEQEPVGYFDSNVLQVPAIHRGSGGWVTEIYSTPRGNCTTPLYTAPPSKPDVNQELVEALEDILSARSRGFGIDYVEGYAETTLRRFHQTPAKYQCSSHPDAPHGFDRNASHSADRYVCECELWSHKHKEQA